MRTKIVETGETIPARSFQKAVWNKARDNARVPMHGMTVTMQDLQPAHPWFKVSDRYQEINVKEALADEDSIFYYYQKLITLRHTEYFDRSKFHILPAGTSRIIRMNEHGMERDWLVAANLSEKEISLEEVRDIVDEDSEDSSWQIIKTNRIPKTFLPYATSLQKNRMRSDRGGWI